MTETTSYVRVKRDRATFFVVVNEGEGGSSTSQSTVTSDQVRHGLLKILHEHYSRADVAPLRHPVTGEVVDVSRLVTPESIRLWRGPKRTARTPAHDFVQALPGSKAEAEREGDEAEEWTAGGAKEVMMIEGEIFYWTLADEDRPVVTWSHLEELEEDAQEEGPETEKA